MTEVGAGEQSARRILAVDAALLIVIVVAVHLGILAQGGQGEFPLWAVGISWFSAGLTLLLGLVARRVSDLSLRTLALVAVVAYWTTLATFAAAVPEQGIDRIPWTLSASGAAAAAALVVGSRALAWATVVAGATAGLVYRTLFGGLDLDGVVNDLQALLTGAVICVIGGHILSVARGLDVAAELTTTTAARESAERGRLAARTRAAALVHDEVLATLALAASDLPIPRDRLAMQGREAASMVTRLTDEQAHEPAVLRVALAEEARLHGASFTVSGEADSRSSGATQDALIRATRQALRNSVQHASRAARAVVLVHTNAEIRVEITDDGPGFDPARIGDDRLGIRQSIVGRMSQLDGGSAEIESAPGRGTLIRLRSAAAPASKPNASEGHRALRMSVAAIAVAYVLTQTVSAFLTAIAVPDSWPLQIAMLSTALVAAEIMRRSPRLMPGRGRTALVVALTCGGLATGAAAVCFSGGLTYSYGTMWFAVAFAFLFVTLAFRGRIAVALAGAGLIVVVVVTAGILAGASPAQIVEVAARPLIIVGLAAALIVVIERMQRRIAVLHRDTQDSAERESWTIAARSELTVRVAELARTAMPLLERIGEGGEATAGQRREYGSCEGELRDGLRAGVLAREPLIASVAAARERGVDVLLLDDSGGAVDDQLIDPILTWMAAAIATARGRAVGRLLPPGRDARASVTIDGRHSTVRATTAVHGPVMSFHGE